MAFTIEISNESCDKCGRIGDDENPIIQLTESTRNDRHVIFIHQDCFTSGASRVGQKEVPGGL